jgi:hypothetical protein
MRGSPLRYEILVMQVPTVLIDFYQHFLELLLRLPFSGKEHNLKLMKKTFRIV